MTNIVQINEAAPNKVVVNGSTNVVIPQISNVTVRPTFDLSLFDTNSLLEGSSNLYFTDERVDDRVAALLVDSSTSGIDISYNDSSGQLTLSVDPTEVEDSVEDIVNGLIVGGTGITSTYDDDGGNLTLTIPQEVGTSSNVVFNQVTANLIGAVTGNSSTSTALANARTIHGVSFDGTSNIDLTEVIQDTVGGMLDDTETFISVTYDDTNGNIEFVVPVKNEDTMSSNSSTHLATQQSIKAYVDSVIQTQESIEDFIGATLTGNTETFIAVTYDDSNSKINFVVPVKDEDNMASNSNTHLPTQQSVKAYVDNQIDSKDALSELSGTLDDITEGSTNLLFTETRARASFSAGTGVSITSGEISVGQAVATSSNVQFNNLVVAGNLTVSGTQTSVNTETINLADNTIILNSNATGSASENGGIEIERGDDTNKTLLWNESSDKWTVGSETFIAGTFEGALTGNVTGNVSGSSGSTTGNAATATVLATGRTVGMTGDVVWTSTSFTGASNVTGTATIQAGAVDFAMIADTVDEDDMVSNSATKLPTQQSVKAYVDASSTDTEEVQDIVGAQISTNGSHTGITVTYDDDGDGALDLSIGQSVATTAEPTFKSVKSSTFLKGSTTVGSSVTIASGEYALAAVDITIGSGVTVTIAGSLGIL